MQYPIEKLPDSLELLIVLETFNITATKWPNTLKRLHLKSYHINPLENLPDSLEELILPASYIYDIANILDLPNLKKLDIAININVFSCYQPGAIIDKIPQGLKYLSASVISICDLPDSLEYLCLASKTKSPMVIKKLPPNLQVLKTSWVTFECEIPKYLAGVSSRIVKGKLIDKFKYDSYDYIKHYKLFD
jgi:hypothetical protein